MILDAPAVAEGFSRRNFEEAFPYLSERVTWRIPGTEDLEGRIAVLAACRSTSAALRETRIDVARFTVVDGGGIVAVESLIHYHDGDEISAVASCDLYEFVDGMIVSITSYSVEV